MKKGLIYLLALILSSTLLFAGCSPGVDEGPRIGTSAPDFKLTGLDGQTVSLKGLRGKPVLLNFWATTCPPCRLEMPYLQAVFDEWTNKGLVLLTVNLGEDPKIVSEFTQKYSLTLPVLLDSNYEVARKYNIGYIPATYFIDKEGTIQNRVVGAFPNKGAIDRYLQPLFSSN